MLGYREPRKIISTVMFVECSDLVRFFVCCCGVPGFRNVNIHVAVYRLSAWRRCVTFT